jgi:hypothetical protein
VQIRISKSGQAGTKNRPWNGQDAKGAMVFLMLLKNNPDVFSRSLRLCGRISCQFEKNLIL